MVGQWTVTKPSRSDEVMNADQQLQITNQIRAQFDSLAPNRPTKPSRSESDTTTHATPFIDADGNNIPELDKLRSLQSQSSAVLSVDGDNKAQDEFVETQYYKELGSINKLHHTTGSGFIKVVREEDENGYEIQLSRGDNGGASVFSTYRSNPAMNDWVPSSENDQLCSIFKATNHSPLDRDWTISLTSRFY